MSHANDAFRAQFLLHFAALIYFCSGAPGIQLECDGLGGAYLNGRQILQITSISGGTSGVVSWVGALYRGDSLSIVSDAPNITCAAEISYTDITGSAVSVATYFTGPGDWKAATLPAGATSQNIAVITGRGFFHCDWKLALKGAQNKITLKNPITSSYLSNRTVLRTNVGNIYAGCLPIRITASGTLQFFINEKLVASGTESVRVILGLNSTLQYGDVVAASVSSLSGLGSFSAMIETAMGFWDSNNYFLWRGTFATDTLLASNSFANSSLSAACNWPAPVVSGAMNSKTMNNIGIQGFWPVKVNAMSTTALFRTVIGVGEASYGCSSTPTCMASSVVCS